MMKLLLVLLLTVVAANASLVGIAHLKGTLLDPNVDGTVYFVQYDANNVWVWASITGISTNPDTNHGMHVHQFGDIFDRAAGSTLSTHYIGQGSPSHACETNATRHEGDMGNWQATSGSIMMSKNMTLLALSGANSIIGKGLVLHSTIDDCGVTGNPTGNSGTRLATAVIGIANPTFFPTAVSDFITATGGQITPNGAMSSDANPTKAFAWLTPTTADAANYPNVTGWVVFEQNAGGVQVTAAIYGLKNTNAYGFHIHTYADYYNTGTIVNGTSAGPHWDLNSSTPHGGPQTPTHHMGDLGNICTYDGMGVAYYSYLATYFSINSDNSILGRNIIVHNQFDNMTVAGASALGARVSLGVIGVMNNTLTAASRITLPTGPGISDPACATVIAPTNGPSTTPTTPAGTSAAPGTSSKSSSTGSPVATTSAASSLVSFVATCALAVLFVALLF